ncbi:MAG: metalloregulator ArsR/SmtB family transcription factor [Proteobacteria bacterium]|nr:metalloregulator ArsR/SmtB family transcription factor [Pseudomonadota bacterium]MCP4918708.1 metalloregulator ArsR/SmtB family transcription factor [Pseudomonadota bacterium]
MLNNDVHPRAFKNDAYAAFADIAKSLASPRRLELLDVLVQGPRPVEGLARATGMSMASTSQHLQVLRRAHVVETERDGTTIHYGIAPGVIEVFVALRRLAESRSADLAQAKTRFYGTEAIDREDLLQLLARDRVTLIDVRPVSEFEQGHIEGAQNVPIEELAERIDELPRDRLVVATCRGPYCVFADDAVQMLTRRGYVAQRFEDGVAEWAIDGGSIG